jgi:hypothetical protein
MTTLIQFKKGDILFRQGDASECVLRVRSGEIEILREVGEPQSCSVMFETASGWARWAFSRVAAAARPHAPSRTAKLRASPRRYSWRG